MSGPRQAPTLGDWLDEAPFGLCLSAGFFGFFAHAGVVSVLEDEGLLPSRVSGASAGALVGGLWAAGVEASTLQSELLALRRQDFWDPWPGPGLLRGRLFRRRLERLLPVASFAECRFPLSVSVYDLLTRRTRALAEGPLAPAIQASCSLPLLFQPTWHGRRPLLDGGILDRSGLSGMPAGTRVLYHHLATRSPWRRRSSAALEIPRRVGLTALVVDGLPRVGPFRLEAGVHAFEVARAGMRAALRAPLVDGRVRVSAPRS